MALLGVLKSDSNKFNEPIDYYMCSVQYFCSLVLDLHLLLSYRTLVISRQGGGRAVDNIVIISHNPLVTAYDVGEIFSSLRKSTLRCQKE